MVDQCADFHVRPWRCAGESGARQQRQVGPVVAHHREGIPADLEPGEQRRHRRELVGDGVERLTDAEIGKAAPQRRRVASADDNRHDAAARKQLQPVAVEGRERLQPLAVLVDVDAAVGENAVDVEERRPNAVARAARNQKQLRSEAERRFDRTHRRETQGVTRRRHRRREREGPE